MSDVLDDIKAWLSQAPEGVDANLWFGSIQKTLFQAGDEIERLRAENEAFIRMKKNMDFVAFPLEGKQ